MGAAQICRYCGYRFAGESGEKAEALSSHHAGQGMLIWGLVSGGLAVLGAFGPWVTVVGVTVSGTSGSNDGWIVVLLIAVGLGIFWVNRDSKKAGWGALLSGGLSTAATVYDREHVSRIISQGGVLARALTQIGWGLNLAAAASLSLAVCGLVWLRIPEDVEASATGDPIG